MSSLEEKPIKCGILSKKNKSTKHRQKRRVIYLEAVFMYNRLNTKW